MGAARSLRLLGDAPEPKTRPRFAVLGKGFRPFFLIAACFAAAIVPLWLLIQGGVIPTMGAMEPAVWHAHEMIFGFSVAVIAGFLLTAVANWTGRETLTGAPLFALAALWVLGRAGMALAGVLPAGGPAVADLAFLPALTLALARPLIATGNRRNFVLIAILSALFAANLVVHLASLGVLPGGLARRALVAGLDAVLVVVAIILGRVLPTFTRNATQAPQIRSIAWLDVASVASMAALAIVDALGLEGRAVSIAAGVAATLAAGRATHWGALRTRRHPLLWILHAGHAWFVIGLALRAAASVLPSIPTSSATHALTVGAVGSLTLGMMARVSLGHTGRSLAASPAMTWAFAAVSAAGILRVFLPWMLPPSAYHGALVAAGALWSVAFAAFVVDYARLLLTPRADGKAG